VSEQRVEMRLHVSELPAWRLVLALWGGLALLDTARLLGGTPAVQVAAVTALVAVCSYGVPRTVAVCVAAIGWLLVNGFVVHELGQLGFTGGGDVVRAGLLLVVALYAAGGRR
jgi:hypothetical protein